MVFVWFAYSTVMSQPNVRKELVKSSDAQGVTTRCFTALIRHLNRTMLWYITIKRIPIFTNSTAGMEF
jgi:hypothetical protein